MKRIASLLFFAAVLTFPALAQSPECAYTRALTTTGGGTPFDNRLSLCQSWNYTVSVAGFTAQMIQFEGAPDVAGSPGTYAALQSVQGPNPGTGTASFNVVISPGSNAQWIRANLLSVTGSGTVTLTATATYTTASPLPGANVPRPLSIYTYTLYPVFDASKGDSLMVLTGNVTKFGVIGLSVGSYFQLTFCQDATGSRSVGGVPSNLIGFGVVMSTASTCETKTLYSSNGTTAQLIDDSLIPYNLDPVGNVTFSTGNVTFSFNTIFMGTLRIAPGQVIQFLTGSGSTVAGPVNGNLLLQNAAQTGFSLLQFGGTTTAFGAIKSVGNGLAFRTAADTIPAFSTLPACGATTEGALIPISDSTTALYGIAIVGGGTNHLPAYCNGTAWVAH